MEGFERSRNFKIFIFIYTDYESITKTTKHIIVTSLVSLVNVKLYIVRCFHCLTGCYHSYDIEWRICINGRQT